MNIKTLRFLAASTFLSLLPSPSWSIVTASCAGLSNDLITPNADGFNDFTVLTYNNLMGDPVTGQIFNTRGELIDTMTPGPILNSQQWDGIVSGSPVAPDLYYVKLAAPNVISEGVCFVVVSLTDTVIIRGVSALPSQTRTLDATEASNALNLLTFTGAPDPFLSPLVGKTVKVVIKGREEGSVSLVGGPRGYVNPRKSEKLTVIFKPDGPGSVIVKVFDSKGRQVREIVSSVGGTGNGTVQWDGRDTSGRVVSSGVYLIHVKAPGINMTKRTVILK